jgi:hypothetical protein
VKPPSSSSSPSPVVTWHQFFKGREVAGPGAGGPRRTVPGSGNAADDHAPTEWANTEWAETLWPEGGADEQVI